MKFFERGDLIERLFHHPSKNELVWLRGTFDSHVEGNPSYVWVVIDAHQKDRPTYREAAAFEHIRPVTLMAEIAGSPPRGRLDQPVRDA